MVFSLEKLADSTRESRVGAGEYQPGYDRSQPNSYRSPDAIPFRKFGRGIRPRRSAGLLPIKLNSVIVRGFNDENIPNLAQLSMQHNWQVRFIEMMPFGGTTDLQTHQVVTTDEVISILEAAFGKLEIINDGKMDGEAVMYRIPGAPGQVGFISSVTKPFCAFCTRARLTADGNCAFASCGRTKWTCLHHCGTELQMKTCVN